MRCCEKHNLDSDRLCLLGLQFIATEAEHTGATAVLKVGDRNRGLQFTHEVRPSGRELDEYMFHGPAIDRETLSNYSIKSNRCYVTLDDHNGSPGNWHRLRGLYDGQTREELAYAEYFTKRQPNGQNINGHIYSEGYNGPCGDKDECGFSKADAYIDERMKREE